MEITRAEGSARWYSARDGWRLLDDSISKTNGPTAGVLDGQGGLWCALFGGAQLARFTTSGLTERGHPLI